MQPTLFGVDILKIYIAKYDLLFNVVIVNLNMSGLGMKHCILCQLYIANIVMVYDNLFNHL